MASRVRGSAHEPHAEHLLEMVRPTPPSAEPSGEQQQPVGGDSMHEEGSQVETPSADQQGEPSQAPSSPHHLDGPRPSPKHAPKPGSSSSSSSNLDLGKLILPAITAIGAAALLWLKVRGNKPRTATTSATMKKATSKAGTPKKGSSSKRSTQAASRSTATADAQSPAAAPEEAQVVPEPEEIAPPDEFTILASPLELRPPASAAADTLPLNAMTFVVSENVDVEGSVTSFGVQAWADHCTIPPGTAPVVNRAVTAGAACIGKAAMQPAGLDMVGASYGNVFNKTRVTGGGHTGAALAVATQQAHFALCDDSAGEARVPAAGCGVYAYRPTPGAFGGVTAGSTPGPRAAQQLSNVVVVAREVNLLLKIAQVLNAPGSSNIKGEVLHCVVAQDLCEMCAPELQPAIYATKKAIIKWAGSDQAGAVQLIRFLSSHVTSWHDLIPGAGKPLTHGYEGMAGGGIHVDDFLQSALVACEILRAEELHAQAGHIQAAVVPAAAPVAPAAGGEVAAGPAAEADGVAGGDEVAGGDDTSTAAAAAEGTAAPVEANVTPADGEEPAADEADAAHDSTATETGAEAAAGSQEQGESATVTEQPAESASSEQKLPETVENVQHVGSVLPPRPSAEQLAAARSFAAEVHECLRTTVKPDTIIVLPVLPFVPPKRAQPEALEFLMFSKLSQCFAAVASLAGCPTLTCPVGNLRDGSPVAICLMAVQKFDQRLLAVAQKLCPMIKETFHSVREEITQMAAQKQDGLPGTPPTGPSTTSAVSNGGAPGKALTNGDAQAGVRSAAGGAGPQGGPGAAAGLPPTDPKKVDKAEKAKAKGNEHYQSGKYVEAMNEYTRAISLHPSCHVYYSNRAMACIKLFRFEQAEEDCNRALAFELTDKDKVKALLRRATARDALQRYEGAEQDLRAVLRLEPNNKQAREDLQALRRHQAQMAQSQAAMVSQLRAQQAAAAAGMMPGAGGMMPGAGGMLPGGLPPGIDPAMFPPGFFGMDGDMGAAYEE